MVENDLKFVESTTLDEISSRLENEPPGTVESKIECELYFEKLNLGGLTDMYNYSINPKLYQHFEFPKHKTLEDTKEYLKKLLERMRTKADGRAAMYWFVRKKTDSKLIGTIGLFDIDTNRRSAEWGYGVDPDLWGKGYILEMQETVKHYAFERLNLNRLTSRTSIHNKETISSVVSAGFKCEGVLRHFYRFSNHEFVDAKIFSILSSEYFAELKQGEQTHVKLNRHEITRILAKVFNVDNVSDNAKMDDVSNWDSLNHINIIVMLEKESGYKFSPKQISQLRSVDEIYNLLNNCSNR